MKNSKTIPITIIALVMIALAGIFYKLSHSSPTPTTPTSNSNYAQQDDLEYYWYSGEGKTPITLSLERFGVRFIKEADEDDISSLVSQRSVIQSYDVRNTPLNIYSLYLQPGLSKEEAFREMMFFLRSPETEWVGPVFTNGLTLQSTIVLNTKQGVSEKDILDLASGLGLEVVLKHEGTDDESIFNLPENEYLFKLPKDNYEDPMSVLRISNILHESDLTEFAHPDFLIKFIETYQPNDEYFEIQNNLPQIRAPEAWDIEKGNPEVVIAILEQDGIDFRHEDLGDNVWQNIGEDLDGDGKTFELVDNQWVFDPDDEDSLDTDGNGLKDDFIGWDFYT